jgi:hypothetical protein
VGLVASLARTSLAVEPPPRTALGWTRLPGADVCIGTKDLALAVERRLGRAALVSAAQAERFVVGRVEPASVGFRVHLTVLNARSEVLGTRELEDPDPSCRALDEQLALVVSLLIDPDSAFGPPPAPPRETVVAAPAPSPPRDPWRALAALGPAVMVGLLPKVGGAGSLRAEITPPSFVPIAIGGTAWLSVDAGAPSDARKGATVSISYATLGLCPLGYRMNAMRFRGCADLAVGAIRSIGQGFAATNVGGELPFAAAMLSGRASFRIVGPLDVGVGLSLTVPFTRPEFVYTDASKAQEELFRLGPVAGVFDAAIGMNFP